MNHTYPDKWHPVYFLVDALAAIGIRADFARDERTLNCWGMVFPDFDDRVMIWLIDNRIPPGTRCVRKYFRIKLVTCYVMLVTGVFNIFTIVSK